MPQQVDLEDPRDAKKRKLAHNSIPSLVHASIPSSNYNFQRARSSASSQHSSSLFNRSLTNPSPQSLTEVRTWSWEKSCQSFALSLPFSLPVPKFHSFILLKINQIHCPYSSSFWLGVTPSTPLNRIHFVSPYQQHRFEVDVALIFGAQNSICGRWTRRTNTLRVCQCVVEFLNFNDLLSA